jgi:hypothetical protein
MAGAPVSGCRNRVSDARALRLEGHNRPFLLSSSQDDVRKNFTPAFGVLRPEHFERSRREIDVTRR